MEEAWEDLGDGLEGRRETHVSAREASLRWNSDWNSEFAPGKGAITAVGAGWNLIGV